MNQETFLKQLEQLLMDIPEEERKEALEYYRCYFEDAGEENEASVIEELQSPERVAKTIKADLNGDTAEGGFTENGYEEFLQKDVPVTKEQIDEGRRNSEQQSSAGKQSGQSGRSDGFLPLRILGILVMCIASVVVVVVMVAVAVALGAAALTVGGVSAVLISIGFGTFVSGNPAVALGMFCGGSICLAVFVLLLLAVVAYCAKAMPPAIRGICNATATVCFGKRRRK